MIVYEFKSILLCHELVPVLGLKMGSQLFKFFTSVSYSEWPRLYNENFA